jgi:hypothetical protein
MLKACLQQVADFQCLRVALAVTPNRILKSTKVRCDLIEGIRMCHVKINKRYLDFSAPRGMFKPVPKDSIQKVKADDEYRFFKI